MLHYLAPLEGITNALYRNTHHKHFSPLDKYITPFFVPNEKDGVSDKDRKDMLPERNQALPLVPQLLCNRPAEFLKAAQLIQALGYPEVNLNLGCPSGTVVSKGRGAGFLANPVSLTRFLDDIFAQCPIAISIKTRIGFTSPEEFPQLMALFNQYPVSELMIHPRLRKDMYRNQPDMDAFRYALFTATMPICYSGDLFSQDQLTAFTQDYPQVKAVLLGRGLIANPGLSQQGRGEKPLSLNQFAAFHWDLYRQYQVCLYGQRPVLQKMKELWYYMICLFPDHQKHAKRLRKSQTLLEFESAVASVFRELSFDPSLGFQP